MTETAVAAVHEPRPRKRPFEDEPTPTPNAALAPQFAPSGNASKHPFPATLKQHPGHAQKAQHPSNTNTSGGGQRRAKRARNPSIIGQKLPVTRLVEVLDHQSLQELFQAVMSQHPQIAATVSQLAPRPAVQQAVQLIEHKAKAIHSALPYKCETDSDYSYIRVKPVLTEFLHCISDFVLDMLPPAHAPLRDSCSVLNVITNMVHELPPFRNKEFQYTRAMAYEQLAHSWLILLQRGDDDEEVAQAPDKADRSGHVASGDRPSAELARRVELAKTADELGLLEQLQVHDEHSLGKFAPVLDYVRSELAAMEQLTQASPSGSIFSDLITVDYSNYSISARTSH